MKQVIISLLVFYSVELMAQDKVNNALLSWWNVSSEFTLSEKISVASLYSWRRDDFVTNWQQSLLRVGVNYKLSENFTITPGYDWVVTFPYGEQPIPERFTEHRLFEQFTLKQNVLEFNVNHRYRLEQRFFDNSSQIRHRARYRLGLSWPIGKAEKLSIDSFNEIFINYGSGTNNHYFDQNWIYGGLGYKLSRTVAIKFGYTNQYILKGDNVRVENNHTVQFALAVRSRKQVN